MKQVEIFGYICKILKAIFDNVLLLGWSNRQTSGGGNSIDWW
jgi:hypothetical protein